MTQESMDLNALMADAEQAVTFKVAISQTEDGDDKAGFVILGKDSKEYQAAARAIRIEGLKKSSKRKTSLDTSTDEGAGIVARLIDSNETTLALAVVVDWFGFSSNGAVVSFNKEIVGKLFAKYPTWREAVSAALENNANFMKS